MLMHQELQTVSILLFEKKLNLERQELQTYILNKRSSLAALLKKTSFLANHHLAKDLSSSYFQLPPLKSLKFSFLFYLFSVRIFCDISGDLLSNI